MTESGSNTYKHRVDEIRELSDRKTWKHCPGSLNPADIPSRGIAASELINQTSWWQSPAFLSELVSGGQIQNHVTLALRPKQRW